MAQMSVPYLRYRWPVLAALASAVMLAAVFASLIGAKAIPLPALLQGGLSESEQAILTAIRVPRILLSLLVGGALAVSGAALQGLFRNPLAEPGLIGISAGAGLAAAIVIVSGGAIAGFAGFYLLLAGAFAGALAACWLIFRIAAQSAGISVSTMLLAGIAINALAGALTSALAYIGDDQQLRALIFWSMGNLGGALWPAVIAAASCIIPAAFVLIRQGGKINLLLLGEEEARHLGLDCERLKRILIFAASLCAAGAVAVSGIIIFVGLIVPHILRLVIGPDHRLLLPASALGGALLLVIADSFARTVLAPAELPVGILTSLVGGPFFLFLLVRHYSGRLD